jgi:hypothetical protein
MDVRGSTVVFTCAGCVLFGGRLQSGALLDPPVWSVDVTSSDNVVDAAPHMVWQPLVDPAIALEAAISLRRTNHVAVCGGDTSVMYVHGGVGAGGNALSDVWAVSLAQARPRVTRLAVCAPTAEELRPMTPSRSRAKTTTQLEPWLPEPRHSHAAAWLPSQGLMVISGGLSSCGVPLTDCALFDPRTQRWSMLAMPLPFPMAGHSLHYRISSDMLYCYGGSTHQDVWFVSMAMVAAHSVAVARRVLPTRESALMTASQRRQQPLQGSTWLRASAATDTLLPPARKHAAAVLMSDRWLLVIAGTSLEANVQKKMLGAAGRLLRLREPARHVERSVACGDAWTFDCDTRRWHRVDLQGLKFKSTHPCAVNTVGNQLAVFGAGMELPVSITVQPSPEIFEEPRQFTSRPQPTAFAMEVERHPFFAEPAPALPLDFYTSVVDDTEDIDIAIHAPPMGAEVLWPVDVRQFLRTASTSVTVRADEYLAGRSSSVLGGAESSSHAPLHETVSIDILSAMPAPESRSSPRLPQRETFGQVRLPNKSRTGTLNPAQIAAHDAWRRSRQTPLSATVTPTSSLDQPRETLRQGRSSLRVRGPMEW